MKKKDIINLITSHYENDPILFFRTSLKVLKEFKDDGDDALVKHLDFILRCHVKIRPKADPVPNFTDEISFDDAIDLGWVPMEKKDNNE